jgi:flagellar motor protein MotB
MMNGLRPWTATILMLLCAASLGGCQNKQLQEERNALFAQNQELQERLNMCNAALDSAQSEAERLSNENARVNAQLQQALAQPPMPVPVAQPVAANPFGGIEGVETIQDRGQITVRVPGDVLFASGKIDLKTDALRTLDRIAQVIQSEYRGNTIRVVGFTDTDPISKSKWKDNLELSLQRAASVHRHLQSRGVAPERMEAAGAGEWHPRDTKARSRRVEIVVVLQ